MTVISNDFFEKIRTNKQINILPVHNTVVSGADGKRSQRIKYQLLVDVKINELVVPTIFLVVPMLAHNVILGNDWLRPNKIIIDYDAKNIAIRQKILDENRVMFDISSQKSFVQTQNLQTCAQVLNNDKARGTHTEQIENDKPDDFECRLNDLIAKSDITNYERDELKELIREFRDIFSDKPGLCRHYEHTLQIKTHEPVTNKSYPIPHAHREKVREKIHEMLNQGIIERACSPYNNPIHVVKKKNGGIRICLDARQVNKVLIGDAERPPDIGSIMQRYAGKKYFSTFDVTEGYFQILLNEKSRPYTAFLFEGAQYQFRRVPFGLQTAGAGFIRALRTALGDDMDKFITVYVDDVMVASNTFNEHLTALRILFNRLRTSGMKFKLGKTAFCREKIEFLGMIITPQGIVPDVKRVKAIREIPDPRSLQELQRFIGLCNYYRRFFVNHSIFIEPLRELLQTNKPFLWNEKHQRAFREMKDNLARYVMLNHFDPEAIFFVQTDASKVGISAILYQKSSAGDNMIIGVVSRLLTKYESNYTTTELELLAIIFAFVKFRVYLIGNHFRVISDHQALTFLLRTPFQSARLTRWCIYMQQYSYTVEHCIGKDNEIADYFSRMGSGDMVKRDEALIISRMIVELSEESDVSANDWVVAQLRVKEPIKKLFNDIREMQARDSEVRKLMNRLEEGKSSESFCLREEVLFYKNSHETRWRLVVPKEICATLVEIIHDEGHLGVYKTVCAIKRNYFWRGIARDVKKFIRQCDMCQRTKVVCQPMTGAYQAIVPNKPNELVCLDFYGPLPASRGGVQYILVALDAFSKHVTLYSLKKATTRASLKKLFQDYIPKMGKMNAVLTDHGTQFTSRTWRETLRDNDVVVRYSSIRHPQSDPAERTMRELSRFFRAYCSDTHTRWAHYLGKIEEWLNFSTHVSTGMMPYELHFGKLPSERIREIVNFPENVTQSHEIMISIARDRLMTAGQKRREKQKNCTRIELLVGDKVLIKALRVSNALEKQISKFFHLYTGPYVIMRKIGENAFELASNDNTDRSVGIYNRVNLRKYYSAECRQSPDNDHVKIN